MVKMTNEEIISQLSGKVFDETLPAKVLSEIGLFRRNECNKVIFIMLHDDIEQISDIATISKLLESNGYIIDKSMRFDDVYLYSTIIFEISWSTQDD